MNIVQQGQRNASMSRLTQTSDTKKFHEAIINSLLLWSKFSKSWDYKSMVALVELNSDFYELTLASKNASDKGLRYYHEFYDLQIVSVTDNSTEAIVKGRIKLKTTEAGFNHKGCFLSNCHYDDQARIWKLGEIKIDWE